MEDEDEGKGEEEGDRKLEQWGEKWRGDRGEGR